MSQIAQPASPRPIIRLQAEDEPRPPARPAIPETRPTRLALPAPEELGIDSAPASVATDWAAVHRRLDELGATCFHLDKVADGGYRVTCLLPTGQPSRTHRVEAQAASEATALALALERVETWVKRR